VNADPKWTGDQLRIEEPKPSVTDLTTPLRGEILGRRRAVGSISFENLVSSSELSRSEGHLPGRDRHEGEGISGFVEIPAQPGKRPLSENELGAALNLLSSFQTRPKVAPYA
jgi:hypothetical protein